MKHLDLCSGIGGFALAAQWAGEIETVGFCEIDPWARQVLNKNFPGIPITNDVTELEGNEYGRIELISAGYPCQPFSIAGDREGQGDDRHIWPEILRIIKNTDPRWILLENVIGHISLGLDEVLSDLDAEGYASFPIVIPASAMGAGHRRNRVYIIANAGGKGFEGHNDASSSTGRESSQDAQPCNGITGTWSELGKCRGGIRPSNGLSAQMVRDQSKGYGNAIVPQVAEQIFRAILKADKL